MKVCVTCQIDILTSTETGVFNLSTFCHARLLKEYQSAEEEERSTAPFHEISGSLSGSKPADPFLLMYVLSVRSKSLLDERCPFSWHLRFWAASVFPKRSGGWFQRSWKRVISPTIFLTVKFIRNITSRGVWWDFWQKVQDNTTWILHIMYTSSKKLAFVWIETFKEGFLAVN